jgi:hypothetical protein
VVDYTLNTSPFLHPLICNNITISKQQTNKQTNTTFQEERRVLYQLKTLGTMWVVVDLAAKWSSFETEYMQQGNVVAIDSILQNVDERSCLNHAVENALVVALRKEMEVQSESVLMEVLCYKRTK